jgi:arsenite-transporting ATPase
MRVIIFSGNGGAGVTTMAAATAVASAAGGTKTLAYGLNPGLAEALAFEGGPKPVEAAPKLWAIEGHRSDSPDEFRDWLEMLLDWRSMDLELADDLAALPGMNHVGRLLEMESYIDSGEYEAVILDAAPLVQFLDLPPALDASARWLERLFAPRQANVFEPFLRVFAGDYASAGEDVLEKGRALLGRLAALRKMLEDVEVSSVRLVLSPVPGAAETARHAVTALGLFSCPVDAAIVNNVLPEAVTDPFFAPLRDSQATSVAELRAALGPLPVLATEMHAGHVRGKEQLSAIAKAVYGKDDPLEVMHSYGERSVSKDGQDYVMSVPLPLATKDDLDLEETDNGVAVHLNGRRCVIPLPEDARYYDRASWSLEDGRLTVVFER